MPRILVLDDEPLIAMLVDDWLNEMACETVGPASSVPAALALIDGAELDGAILDLRLGDHDSYAVAAMLQERGIPFAFATGHRADLIEERFRDVPTLAKPYDIESLRRTLTTLLGRKMER